MVGSPATTNQMVLFFNVNSLLRASVGTSKADGW